jgi:LMBR1 domain-containing protein 1
MEGVLVFILTMFLVAFLLSGLKVIWMYEMPEDAMNVAALFPKLVFLCSMTLAGFVTILLPLDVRQEKSTGTGLTYSWSTVYIMIIVFVSVLIPLAMMIYEAAGDEAVSLGQSIPFLMLKLLSFGIFFGLIIGFMYAYYNLAKVPIRAYSCTSTTNTTLWDMTQTGGTNESSACYSWRQTYLSMKLRLDVYLIAVTSFVGWFLFIFFGGVGLSALPIDLIVAFADRPKKTDLATYTKKKQEIGEQARSLSVLGKELIEKERSLRIKSGWGVYRQKTAVSTEFNKYKQSVFLLEVEYRKLEIALKNRGVHPLIAAFTLITGLICFGVSVTWWLHILLYMLIPSTSYPGQPFAYFLNTALIAMDTDSGYIGSFFVFSFFCLYLLCCTVKGAFKVGMRIFIVPMYPMVLKDTPISSMLFNAIIVLLSAAALAQFSYMAFADYAAMSTAQVVFSAQIQYLNFYKWFFGNSVFVYAFLCWSLFCFMVILVWPREKAAVRMKRIVAETIREEGLVDAKKAMKQGNVPMIGKLGRI